MGDRRNADPRLNDRHRISSDPRLNAVKPAQTERYNNNSQGRHDPRQKQRRGSSQDAHVSSTDNDSVPARYSPPPSLKPYTIPRRAGQKILLKPTGMDSREGTFAIETIKSSLWNPDTIMFEFTRIEMVNNDRLEAEYITKRKELKEAGRTTSEISDCFVFSHIRSKDEIRDVCVNGISCKKQHHISTTASCSLGDKNYGVYLCRCADVIRRKALTLQYGKECIMLICKIMKGRVKTMNDHADAKDVDLEPTPDFDAHISRRFQRGKKMNYDHIYDSSQIYLYELNLDNFSTEDDTAIFAKRPRQCLPFAVVYFKAKQIIMPVVEPMKLPMKDPVMSSNVINVPGQTSIEAQVGEQTYEDCLKSMKYLWKGFYFMKTKFVTPIQIGVFSKKDIYFPMETTNLTIQQKISWERLSKILPGKIYRKPPSKSLLPETEVVGIKFLHGEIHAVDQSSEPVIQKLQSSWLKSNMAGVCTLSSGYKMFVLPSSVFTDKLGLSDPSYPAILHCVFMKESTESTSMKGSWYEKFIARQQLSLHSRLLENEELKDYTTEVNTCIHRKYAYSVAERQIIARYIAQVKRSQGKRATTKHVEPTKKPHPISFVQCADVAPTCNTDNLNRVSFIPSSNVAVPICMSMNHPLGNPIAPTYTQSISSNLLTTVSTHGPVTNTPTITIISPTSSDSMSGTEQCPDEQQPAIDFCLSFKREGSERTERVKLFPTESSNKVVVPIPKGIVLVDNPLPSNEVPPAPVSTPINIAEAPPISLPNVLPKDLPNVLPKDSPSVLPKDSSSALPKGSSSVLPKDSSTVLPKDSPSVILKDSPRVLPKDSSSALPKDSSSVLPKDSSGVTTKDSSNVLPKDSSSVTTKGRRLSENLTEKEDSDSKVISKEDTCGNMSDDSSRDSEDNLVINLDDTLDGDDTESEINTDIDTKQTEKSANIKPHKERMDKRSSVSKLKIVDKSLKHSTPVKPRSNEIIFDKSSQNLLAQISASFPSTSSSLQNVLPEVSSPLPIPSPRSPSPSPVKLSSYISPKKANTPFSFSTMPIPESPSKKAPKQFSPTREESATESSSQPSNSQTSEPTNITYAVDFPEGCAPIAITNEEDNYDNLTMDEGSEDSQSAINASDHNEVDMECEDDSIEKKPAKCSSPSLSQLTFAKEKILMQLSLLKAQTEGKRKLSKKKVKEPATIKLDSGSESGSESQGSEVIPFLGGDDESEDEESDESPKSPDRKPVKASTSVADKRFKAEGLNAEKAEMAILSIGSEYYDQVSPAISEAPSLKASPPLPASDKEKRPPPPPPPERPVGKVQPVNTTTITSNIVSLPVSSIANSSASTVTTSCSSSSPVCSTSSTETITSPKKSTDHQIPFLSDDPSDKVSVSRISISTDATVPSPLINVSSRPSDLPVKPYPPPPKSPVESCNPTSTFVESNRPSSPLLVSDTKVEVSAAPCSSMGHPPMPPKRPIMEVSPVVRSSSAPWLSSNALRNIPSLVPSGNFHLENPQYRSMDRPMGIKSPLDPGFRDMNPLRGKAFSFNREQADAMFQNRDTPHERNLGNMSLDPAARFKQPLRDERYLVKDKAMAPRTYQLSPPPRSNSRPQTPDDGSPLITPRTYRRSPSPSSDWEQRSLSHRHRSRRRSRSRSPYSRRYYRSRSPPKKRSRDRSPRYDIEAYKDEKSDRSERSERPGRLDRRPERLDRVDRSLRTERSAYSPPPPPPPQYPRNNTKESLDDFIRRTHSPSNLIRPRSQDEDRTRPRRNSFSGSERSPSLPRPHDEHSTEEKRHEGPTIRERVNEGASEEQVGMNLWKKDSKAIDASPERVYPKNGSRITGYSNSAQTDTDDSSSTYSNSESSSDESDRKPKSYKRYRMRGVRKEQISARNEQTGRNKYDESSMDSAARSSEPTKYSDISESESERHAQNNGWLEWLNTPLDNENISDISSDFSNEDYTHGNKDGYTVIPGTPNKVIVPGGPASRESLIRSVGMVLPLVDQNSNPNVKSRVKDVDKNPDSAVKSRVKTVDENSNLVVKSSMKLLDENSNPVVKPSAKVIRKLQ